MADTLRVGIIGGGWPAGMHARAYASAGGFKLHAISDLIPDRRKKLMAEFSIPREYANGEELIRDKDIDVISNCLPNDLHALAAVTALRAGKHVLCEVPPTVSSREARRMSVTAEKNNRVLMYAFQRRFGGHEQAAKAAIEKQMIGDVYHIRSTWTRTRAIPRGTQQWFTQKQRSGGGVILDIGAHMLDLGWNLLGRPRPLSIYGVTRSAFSQSAGGDAAMDVEDQGFAIIRFEGNRTLELAATWAINQPPQQNGTVCRVYGTTGAIEVYTPAGAMLYRDFKSNGQCRENPLKPPKTTHYPAMVRHFRQCILGKAAPSPGPAEGIALMQMIEAIYKSAESGRAVAM